MFKLLYIIEPYLLVITPILIGLGCVGIFLFPEEVFLFSILCLILGIIGRVIGTTISIVIMKKYQKDIKFLMDELDKNEDDE